MGNSSFISKKFIFAVIFITAVIGFGVGCYYLFRQKVDIETISTNFYEFTANTQIIGCENHIDNIANNVDINKLSSCTVKYIANDSENYINMLNNFSDYLTINNVYNQSFIVNFQNIKTDNRSILTIQNKINNSYNSYLKQMDVCEEYYKNYLQEYLIKKYSNELLLQKLEDYTNRCEKLTTLKLEYYVNLSNLFDNYLNNNLNLNRYSCAFISLSTNLNKYAFNEFKDYLKITNSTSLFDLNIKDFTKNFKNINKNEYFERKDVYDTAFDAYYNLFCNDLLKSLINFQSFSKYVKSLEETNPQKIGILSYYSDFFTEVI